MKHSACVNDILRAMNMGKHVLLTESIHDWFFYDDVYTSLPNMVTSLLLERQFDIVTTWDSIDGFLFAGENRESMQRRFTELSASTESGTHDQRVRPSRRGGNPCRITAPNEAFSLLRGVLRNNTVATAVIINYADLLAEESDGRLQPEDREVVARLHKMITESAYLSSSSVYRNVVVMIAKDLAKVPPWLYANSSDIEVLSLRPPSRSERIHFLNNFMDDESFYDASSLGPNERRRVIEDIGDATDGLTIRDLNALGATSLREQLPVIPDEISTLVNYYKNGFQADPWKSISKETVQNAPALLRKRVLGQEHAIKAVQEILMGAQTGITASGKINSQEPKGILFFVGMTGVGKTELAKSLAELIFKDEDALIRFDMSEYAQEHAAEKFTGAPPGFVGYEEGGRLTNAVRQRPQSVILFDELDKCHPKIYEKFISILEDGRLTDGKGDTAYFNQSVLIFTSNIGTQEFGERYDLTTSLPSFEEVKESFQCFVEDFINNKIGRPELKGRLLNAIIPFDILRPEFIAGILEKFMEFLQKNLRKTHEVVLSYDNDAVLTEVTDFIRREAHGYGGRGVKLGVEKLVVRPLQKYFTENAVNAGSSLHICGSETGLMITNN